MPSSIWHSVTRVRSVLDLTPKSYKLYSLSPLNIKNLGEVYVSKSFCNTVVIDRIIFVRIAVYITLNL